ncbi:hypothetical protein ACFL4T_00665 [candidate division KSB1 bacterium]
MIRTIENRWMNRPPLILPEFKITKKPSARAVIQTGVKNPKEFFDLTKLKLKLTPDQIGSAANQIQKGTGKIFDVKV